MSEVRELLEMVLSSEVVMAIPTVMISRHAGTSTICSVVISHLAVSWQCMDGDRRRYHVTV
jgi:hypothetical protein